MGIARNLSKNFFYQIGTNLAIKLTNLFLVIFLTTLLVPKDFGLYSWIISIAMLFEIFAELGTSPALLKFLPEARAKNDNEKGAFYFRHLFRKKLKGIIAVSAFTLVFADLMATFIFNKPYLAFPLRFSLLILITYTLFSFLQHAFLSFNENKYVFYANFVFQTLLKVFLMAGLVIIMGSFLGALIGYAVTMAMASIYLFFTLRKKFPFLMHKGKGSKTEVKRVESYSNFSFLSSFALILLVNIDILMISALLPIENVGFYSIAMSMLSAFSSVFPLVVAFPIFSELAAKKKEGFVSTFHIFFKYLLFALVPVAILLFFVSQPLVGILYHSQYEVMVSKILSVLSPLVLLNGIYLFLLVIYSSIERADISAKIFGASVILDAVLNFLLIGSLGVIGAAYASVIAYLAICSAMLLLLRPVAGIRASSAHLIKPAFAGIVMAACIFGSEIVFPLANPFLKIFITIAVGAFSYLAVQLAIGGLNFKELLFLKDRIIRP